MMHWVFPINMNGTGCFVNGNILLDLEEDYFQGFFSEAVNKPEIIDLVNVLKRFENVCVEKL
jgi:hypothetical protein